MYVVYQHRRKDNNAVFYVGQGILKRAYESISNRRNDNWRKIVKEAGGFNVDILAENLTREESLRIEAEYIKKYGTIKHETGILVNERLNGTRGSESGYKHTEEKKKEISKKTKKAMIEGNLGSKVSIALKKYFANTKNRENLSCNVKVSQYDLEGNFIATYNSMKEAQNKTGIWSANISSACRGLYSQTGGYKWKYC